MAITGEFLADFDSFFRAVNESEGRLGALERQSQNVGLAVDRMTGAFQSGPAVGQLDLLTGAVGRVGASAPVIDTVAGATGRVAPEAERAGTAMGLLNTRIGEVAAGFTLGTLFSKAAGMAIQFGTDTIKAADAIDGMATKFGISSTAVQQFQFISDATGASMGNLAGSAREIAVNVAEGDSSAAGSLKRLGLSIDDLRGKSPDEMFFTVSRALKDVKDAGEQASIAMDIGGKKMVESLGAINSGTDALRAKAPVMQADVVTAIDAITDRTANWAAQQKVDIQNTIGLWAILIEKGPRATMQAYEEMATGVKKPMEDMGAAVRDATGFEAAHTRTLEDKTVSMEEYDRIQQQLTKSTEADIAAKKELVKHDADLARIRDSLWSTDQIDRANLYVEALGGAENASMLTKNKQEELNSVVMKAIDAYVALGETVPAEMLKVANATREGVDPLLDTLSGLIPVTRSFSETSSEAWDTYRATVVDSSGAISQALTTLAAEAQANADALGDAFVENFDRVEQAADETITKISEVAASATNSKTTIEAAFSMPEVNPVTGEGMAGTDPRVRGYLASGYTLSEAISLAQGTGSGIMGPKGTWTAEGYKYGITGDPFAKAYFDTKGVSPTGAGGGTSVYSPTINVGGSVIAEKDLVDTIQRGMVEWARSSGARL